MTIVYTILEQSFLLLPLLLGAYLIISIMRIPFLALESAFVFGAAVGGRCSVMFNESSAVSLLIGVSMAICAGAVVGLCAGLIQQWVPRISSVLASIVTVGLFQAATMFVLQGSHVTLPGEISPLRIWTWATRYPELPVVIVVGLLVAGMCTVFLRTQLGLLCALYGSNHNFLRVHGMNTTNVVLIGMAIGAGFAGISGYCMAQTNGFIDIYAGQGIVLVSITALMLGNGMRILRKKGGMPLPVVPVVGIALYVLLQYLLVAGGFAHQYFNAVQAVLIIGYCVITSMYEAAGAEHNELGV